MRNGAHWPGQGAGEDESLGTEGLLPLLVCHVVQLVPRDDPLLVREIGAGLSDR